MGCHFLLQRIFLTQGSNPGLLHFRQTLPREASGKPVFVRNTNPFSVGTREWVVNFDIFIPEFFFFNIYLFIWILVVVGRIFHSGA